MRTRARSSFSRGPSPDPQQLLAADLVPSPARLATGIPSRGSLSNMSGGTAEKRRSVVVLAADEVLASAGTGAAPGNGRPSFAGASQGARPESHPALARLTSFGRRKSFKVNISGINELTATMDGLEQKIMGSLTMLRKRNTEGLGTINTLHRTKSGKLAASRPNTAKGNSVPAFSPRVLLESAIDDPAQLQRLKFHVEEQKALHDGGVSSARGRLEDGFDARADNISPGRLKDTSPETADGLAADDWEAQLAAAKFDGRKRHTIAVPAPDLKPKWGATEGGRDTLGWVRSLVKFTEGQPFMDPAGKQDSIPAFAALAEDGAAETSAANKPRRQDVIQLQTWLQDMMTQTLAQIGSRAADATDDSSRAASTVEKAPSELADAALWVYGVAFEELQRQVSLESKDRGDLLGAMWEHCFNLVELRCSWSYEEVISGILQELQSTRHQNQKLQGQVKTLEGKVADSLYYSKEKFLDMEERTKHMGGLLAAADEEAEESQEEIEHLKKALQVESTAKAEVEAALHEALHSRDELAQQLSAVTEESQHGASTVAKQQADIAQLRADLLVSHTQERHLAEAKAKLEVDMKRTERDFQAAEILAMSLREQLQVRKAELAQVRSEQADLQQRHTSLAAELQGSQSALGTLQREHETSLRISAEGKAELQRSIDKLELALRESQTQLSTLQLETQTLENTLKESMARENVFSSQLKQLTAAHDRQGGKLRQEFETRKTMEDELQALRAGLQVTQQKLEGMGLVFASSVVHNSSAQAWVATGPLSMGRQVVAMVNQQLTELHARTEQLDRDLRAAKEHWQAEEAVRIKFQEQLLDAKAQLSKVVKDKEALEGSVGRLEKQRAALDNEVTQMRKMVTDAEARAQAAHKKSLEAANETKRLAPLEGKVAGLEDQLADSKAEVCRLQQEVASHQATIAKLLDDKGAAHDELSRRAQALDVASREIGRLGVVEQQHGQLQMTGAQLQAELQKQAEHSRAQEALLNESMQQLAVARQLLCDLSVEGERQMLMVAEEQIERLQQLFTAKAAEVDLLQQRLLNTEQQLQYAERQLGVLLVAHPASGRSSPIPSAGLRPGSAPVQDQTSLAPIVEQLRKVLEVKEDRIRQLDRYQSSAAGSSSQVKKLETQLAGREAELSKLRAEVESLRKKLQTVQEERMRIATRDLSTLAHDAHVPKELAKELLPKHLHTNMRSEIVWTKAKLAVVAHMAKRLRAKLRAEQEARTRAEVESMCIEGFYLQQAIADQRSCMSLFDSTFKQFKASLEAAVHAVSELQQLVQSGSADMDEMRQHLPALSAELAYWLDKFENRVDEGLQADDPGLHEWKEVLAKLPPQRPATGTPTQAAAPVAATIVHVFAHRVEQMLAGSCGSRSHETVFDTLTDYYAEHYGTPATDARSPEGPVASLLSWARAQQHQPRQLLLGLLAGMVPSVSGRVHPEGAWDFLLQLLHCMARLLAASWQTFVKEWAESEEGVGLPLSCVMDVLANVYNTDAPALLDCARRGLVPLIRQGRRGPAIDVDALLLVLVNEFADGRCPVNPLAAPRRLTDGSLANTANYHANAPALPSLTTVSTVAVSAGLVEPYATASMVNAGMLPDGWRQKNTMRKRIVNLTVPGSPRPGSSSSSPESPLAPAGQGTGRATSPSTAGGSLLALAGGSGSGSKQPGASRSPDIFQAMQTLAQANPGLPLGSQSPLRRTAANNGPTRG